MSISVGDRAPAFALPSTGGSTVSLADFAGRPVVLVFYPGDDTPVCTKQLNSYNTDVAQFESLDAQVLGISAQSVDSHERFSDKHGFKFPLLADTDKAVAGLYGTLGPLGFPRRSVFIVAWCATPTVRLPGSRTARSTSSSACCSHSPSADRCGSGRGADTWRTGAHVVESSLEQERQCLLQHALL
jgi:thioredoxin-dependent peroxiredoxin